MEELNQNQQVVEQPQADVSNQAQNKNNVSATYANPNEIEKEEAGCLGIGISVLFPIIGVIIYFAQRNTVKNPSAYLYGALGGFVGGLILRFISAAVAGTL